MNHETTALDDAVFQMVPPLVRPLRLWTPRYAPRRYGMVRRTGEREPVREPIRAFVVKGGFVSMADGERRMVLAGRIFKQHQEC